MTFEDARRAKFARGHREHGESWDPEHINARAEMQAELCDLYNYAELLGDEVLMTRVRLWCKDLWQELEDMGG
jgi:hypothetical protein